MKQAKGFVFKPLSPAPFTELSQRKDVFPLIMYFNTVTLKASLCSRKRVQKKKNSARLSHSEVMLGERNTEIIKNILHNSP